jgi:hypothetical protein
MHIINYEYYTETYQFERYETIRAWGSCLFLMDRN